MQSREGGEGAEGLAEPHSPGSGVPATAAGVQSASVFQFRTGAGSAEDWGWGTGDGELPTGSIGLSAGGGVAWGRRVPGVGGKLLLALQGPSSLGAGVGSRAAGFSPGSAGDGSLSR